MFPIETHKLKFEILFNSIQTFFKNNTNQIKKDSMPYWSKIVKDSIELV
jgi:hypothetical protein